MIVEPGDKQDRFSIWGWGNNEIRNERKGNWVIYHFELNLGKCKTNDFQWLQGHCDSKSKGGQEECCRLGETIKYKQVKQDSICVVDINLSHDYVAKPCTCTKQFDFRCGYGYTRENEQDENSNCIEKFENNKMQKTYDICDKGEEHTKNSIYTAKYRKIAGDKCKIPDKSKSAFNFALIKEEKLLKCLEQQEEPGVELDENDDGFFGH